jgi:NAD(P)-dependent dehydrogenase (short-subunit alcohol dehydrogenase family)
MHEGWKGGTVLGRFARPDEVASTVAFLLSGEADHYCGAELLMGGGYSIR